MALKPLNSVGGFSVGEIPQTIIDGTGNVTANFATFSGNLLISNATASWGVLTDNLYYSNGQPWDLQEAAGSNTQIQFNDNNNFGASANFTFDTATNLLTVTGNAQFNNANLGNVATANYVNVSQQINGNVGNFSGNVTALNANLGNLASANFVNVSSNLTVSGKSNLGPVSNVIITGGSANQYLQTDGAGNLTWTTADTSRILNGTSNVSIPVADGNVNTSVGGIANVFVVTSTGANVTGTFNATGNLTAANADLGNLITANYANFTNDVVVQGNIANANNISVTNLLSANTGNFSGNLNVTDTANVGNLRTNNLLYANGQPWDLQEAAGSNTQIQYNDGNNNFGASANFTFNDATNTLTVNGNANVTNTLLTPNINSGTGNLTLTSNGFSTVYDNTGNVTFPTGGTVTVGTLVGNVQANITITAANTSVLFSDAGLVAGANGFTFDKVSNLFSVPGDLYAAGNANIDGTANINNVYIENGNISGGANSLQLYSTDYVQLNYNNNNYVYTQNDGVWLETNGGGNVHLGTDGNVDMSGNLSVTGNIANVNNISVTNALNANTGNFSGNITSLNANLGNLVEANFVNVSSNLQTVNANVTGTLTVANANISSNLTVNNLTVNLELAGNTANFTGNVVLSGPNVTVNNYLSGNIANFSGNIYALNANLGNIADANYIRTQELYNGTSNIRIAANGNVTVSSNATSNVVTFSDVGVNVVGYVNANGNGTFGALYSNSLTAQGGNLSLYSEQAGNSYVQIRAYGDGTVDVGNTRITSLATPNAASDAATKQYVDDVAQGLNVHDSCYAATANTLANLTGGTITYNNGTAGVGANLVLSGSPTANYLSANVFDGNVTAVVGSRILVKSEANAATNGVYVVDSATVLTRASDYNTVPEVEAGDFIFVQDGTLYNDTGWVQTSVVVTIGTDPIEFTQFSGAGTYQAGAGLTLTGTVFSVNVDNLTTEISGGNVIVKANAQLTTPNIGAATGTSLDLTGNLLANNVNSNNLVTTTTLEATGNILANNISANSNLVVNNATVNLELSGNTANFSGNVILPNLTVNLELVGNTANFSGNVVANNFSTLGSGGNITGANVVSANTFVGNISANTANISSNLTVNNLTVNLELSGNTANFSGNVILPNATVNLELSGNTANFSGNVVVNNLLANGVANVGNLNVVANVTSDLLPNANLTLDLGSNVQRWDNIYGGNLDVSGNLVASGNLTANNFSANVFTANVKVDVGTTQIIYGNVTTTSITSNQTIATALISGVTGVEFLVKGYDNAGAKYSMAMITAVTDGSNVDYSTFGTVNLGSSTGTLAVNVVGSNIELQVTPSSSNSTVWVTQFRTI